MPKCKICNVRSKLYCHSYTKMSPHWSLNIITDARKDTFLIIWKNVSFSNLLILFWWVVFCFVFFFLLLVPAPVLDSQPATYLFRLTHSCIQAIPNSSSPASICHEREHKSTNRPFGGEINQLLFLQHGKYSFGCPCKFRDRKGYNFVKHRWTGVTLCWVLCWPLWPVG